MNEERGGSRSAAGGAADLLTPPGRRILELNSSSAYRRLVVRGDGDGDAQGLLASAEPGDVLSAAVRRPDDGQAVLAGLWLWHDWLSQAHTIAQGIHTPTGSFWHAIMHRREGDFANSKYWYARTRGHPLLASLAANAAEVLNPLPPRRELLAVAGAGGWSPEAFVDLVEEVEAGGLQDVRRTAAVALQRLEWRLLFEHCVREAVG